MQKLSFLLALALLVVAPLAAAQAPPPTPPPAPSAPAEGGDDGSQGVTQISVTVPEGWIPVPDPQAPPGTIVFTHHLGGMLLAGIVEIEGDDMLKTITNVIKQSGVEMVGKPVINPDGTVIVAWQQKLNGSVAFKGRLAIGPLPGLEPDKPVRVIYQSKWPAKLDAKYGPLFNKVIKDGIFRVVP